MSVEPSRVERRQFRRVVERASDDAQRRIKSGKWPAWRSRPVLVGEIGGGLGSWSSEIHTAYENGLFVALRRTIETPIGAVDHLAIRNAGSSDIAWRDKQRIKDELLGPERLAVELFPPASELVDQAMMYHLWVYPEGSPLPFNLNAP